MSGDPRRPPPVPELPPGPPQSRKRLSRVLGLAWLRLSGWRLTGPVPDLAKAVVIGAPHSSNWDGVHALAVRQAMGLDISLMGKRQLFWWPLGPVLRAAGVFPVDRGAGGDLVQAAAAEFARRERFWLGIAPEGTRDNVARWKTGFWRIARAAEVPIVPVYLHYPEKRFGIGPASWTSEDMEADIARLRAFYRPWRGVGDKRAV